MQLATMMQMNITKYTLKRYKELHLLTCTVAKNKNCLLCAHVKHTMSMTYYCLLHSKVVYTLIFSMLDADQMVYATQTTPQLTASSSRRLASTYGQKNKVSDDAVWLNRDLGEPIKMRIACSAIEIKQIFFNYCAVNEVEFELAPLASIQLWTQLYDNALHCG